MWHFPFNQDAGIGQECEEVGDIFQHHSWTLAQHPPSGTPQGYPILLFSITTFSCFYFIPSFIFFLILYLSFLFICPYFLHAKTFFQINFLLLSSFRIPRKCPPFSVLHLFIFKYENISTFFSIFPLLISFSFLPLVFSFTCLYALSPSPLFPYRECLTRFKVGIAIH